MVTHTIRNNKWDNIKSNSYRKGTTATETALFHHKSLCPALTPTGDFLAPQLASNPNVLSQLYVVKSPGLQELWTHTHTHTYACAQTLIVAFTNDPGGSPLISRVRYELPTRSLCAVHLGLVLPHGSLLLPLSQRLSTDLELTTFLFDYKIFPEIFFHSPSPSIMLGLCMCSRTLILKLYSWKVHF